MTHNESELKLPQVTKNGKPLSDEEVKEFEQAFKTREKIVRSPNDGAQHPIRGQGQGGAGFAGGSYGQGKPIGLPGVGAPGMRNGSAAG